MEEDTTKCTPLLSEDDAIRQSRVFCALGDPTRLQILMLIQAHEGTLTVNAIVDHFTLKQPSISHHLRVLVNAGLIKRSKHRTCSYYEVREEKVKEAQRVIGALRRA